MFSRTCILAYLLLVYLVGSGQTIPNGVVAYYPFSGDSKDSLGNNIDAVVNGATLTSDRFGHPNSAYQFDGNSFITLPNSLTIDQLNFSISAWVKITAYPADGKFAAVLSLGSSVSDTSDSQGIFNKTDFKGWGEYGYIRYPDDWDGSPSGVTFNELYSNADAPLGVWALAVFVFSAQGAQMYINSPCRGLGVYYYDVPLHYQYKNGRTTLGSSANGSNGLIGVIDDVRIYDLSLSRSDVVYYFTNYFCGGNPPKAQDVSVCKLGKAKFFATGADYYRWYDSAAAGTLLYSGNPFVTPPLTKTTSYYVCQYDSGFFATGESSRTHVTATVLPLPVITCDFSDNTFYDNPVTISVTSAGGTPELTYLFNFGDGYTITTSDSIRKHTYQSGGNFNFEVVATGLSGCTANCAGEITTLEIKIPNVFTPNGDLLNEKFTAFINDKSGNYIPYQPNGPFSLTVYNRWGETIYTTRDAAQGWDGKNSPAEIYYYIITISEKKYRGTVSLLK